MTLKIYNTLGREKQEFKAIKDGQVSFYYCGPTVYKTQHIGGLRGNLMADLIRRSLDYLGYSVNFVSNYTDVGHLVSDEDSGEDKLNKQALLEQKTPKEIADKAIEAYEQDSRNLNIIPPTIRCRATEYIPEMLEMINTLMEKDFAYKTDLAIYFDISKAKNYTQLSGQKLEDLKSGAGTGDVQDPQKRNSGDFAIWFFKTGTHEKALQTWSSPWGEGFPGWHIECSAMSKKHLGNTIDIHMGGIEHIPTHHTNEIAQSESATGEKFTNYWIHNEHLGVDETKMSKSLGNIILLKDIKEKNFDPLALRFFFLQAHYRSRQNFTWEAMLASQKGYEGLISSLTSLGEDIGKISPDFKKQLEEKLEDDFNIPQALALVFEILKSNLSNEDKLATILDFDKVLGLNLKEKIDENQEINLENLDDNIKNLILEREKARQEKNWDKSDQLRNEIEKQGFLIKDSQEKTKIYKK